MAEKRVPYPLLGWYVKRHVQRGLDMSFDDIAPLVTLARLRCPVLLIHGGQDDKVPVSDAQRLLATSCTARLLLVDGGHDMRGTLAPHAATPVDFLRTACTAAAGQPVA